GKDPAVAGVLYFAGASAFNPTENTARVFIQLKPHDERALTSDQVIQRLRPKVAAVEGAKFFMQSGQDISVGGRLSRTQYQYKVILEVQPQFQDDPSALSKIYVSGPNGVQIPLSSFARFTSKIEPLMLSHQGQFPAVTISFNLAPGVALGEAVDRIQALERELHLPPTVTGSFTGTAQAFQASLSSTPLLVAAAILVVYIVLGVLYESYIHPITILSALPSA